MSNLAQEEADRFFNYKPSATAHPEDAHKHNSDSEGDDDQPSQKGIRSSRRSDAEDRDTDDEDASYDISTMTNTKSSYTVPTTAHYSNTGPKGVITDAQNYHRAKRNGSRKVASNQNLVTNPQIPPVGDHTKGNASSDSDIDLEEEDDFMKEWRQKRLTEMQEQYTVGSQGTTPYNRQTWGSLEQVNANGYLDAIENTPKQTNVVVFIFDPLNADSLEVEDELKMLAYKWSKVRFIKLHYKIAEMQSVEIPAILAYRDGDVFATMSGATADGLEDDLSMQGVLVK